MRVASKSHKIREKNENKRKAIERKRKKKNNERPENNNAKDANGVSSDGCVFSRSAMLGGMCAMERVIPIQTKLQRIYDTKLKIE